MSDEEKQPFPWRRVRRKLAFIALAGAVGCFVAALIGIPIAEVITRRVVVDAYRKQVESYNSARETTDVVYEYNGYRADADHPIEYRLLPDHSRTIPIITGAWSRNTNQTRFLADAWHLVDQSQVKACLRWVCVVTPTNETWHAMFSAQPEDVAMVTNQVVAAIPHDWRRLTRTKADLGSLVRDGEWIYAPGSITDGVGDHPWIYRTDSASVPAKDSSWSYRIDAEGFRATGIPDDRPGKRLLFLGDSWLFGWGVHDHETLTARIEEYMNDGTPVNCINVGVPGYGAEQQYYSLQENFDRCKPDAVVVCQVRNDLEPQMVAPEQPQRIYRHVFLNSWFLERSKRPYNRALRWGHGVSSGLLAELGIGFNVPIEWFWLDSRKFVGKADSGHGWRDGRLKKQEARQAYQLIRDFCAERDCPLLIVSMPNVEGRHFIPIYNVSAHQVRDWANELGVNYLDLMPAIADIPHAPLRVSKTDGHMNARGLAIVARALVQPLNQLLK